MKHSSSAIFADMRHQFADPRTTFTILLELEDRVGHRKALLVAVIPVSRWPWRIESGKILATNFVHLRLVVKQIDLRRTAGLKQINDVLCPWCEMRQPGQSADRVGTAADRIGSQSVASQQSTQGHRTDATR